MNLKNHLPALYAGTAILSTLVLLMGTGRVAPGDVLQAGKIEIVDADANVRGRWSIEPKNEIRLAMFATDKTERIAISTNQEASSLTFFGAEGKPLIAMKATADERSTLQMGYSNDSRLEIAVDKAGGAQIRLLDSKGKLRVHLSDGAKDGGVISVLDADGTPLWTNGVRK